MSAYHTIWTFILQLLVVSLSNIPKVVFTADNQLLYSSTKPSSFIYSLTHHQFSDLLLSSYRPSKRLSSSEGLNLPANYPRKWDWRHQGYISPIKDQKTCGGCWAFAVAETLESVLAKETDGSAHSLSVQQILDCDPGDSGCRGGSTCKALEWLQKAEVRVVPDSEYPLTDKSGKCLLENTTSHSGAVLIDSLCLQPIKNESDILSLLYNYGPLIAGIDANTWNEYLGGIIQYHCGTSINHAVQIVGYDLTGPVPYYIVRNSWGEKWGHDGYVYLSVGGNTCGISQDINVIKHVKWREKTFN